MTDPQIKTQSVPPGRLAADDEIDLLDYFRVVWRYRWMIVVLCFAVMSLTVFLSLRRPRQYQSAATIVPPLDILQKESGGALGALNNSFLLQILDTGAGSIAGMYVEILQSREVVDALVDRFHLRDSPKGTRSRSRAREQLRKNTTVKATKSGAATIVVTDTDPNRAAALATAYLEELDRQNKRLSAGQATSKRIFLENRLKEVEGKLSKIDNILSREAKTQEMLYEWLVPQYEMAKMEEARSMPTIQVLDAPVVPELGVGRGTVRKGIMAGMAACMVGIFLAFAREYVIEARQREDEAISSRKQGAQAPASAAQLDA